MRFISNSIKLVEFMINQDSIYNGKLNFDNFPMYNSSDMSLVHEALIKLSNDSIISYCNENGTISYDINVLQQFVDFYTVRKKLDQLYCFIKQVIRDACCVRHFKAVLKTTGLTRETMASCIYNFSSAVSININKLFVDNKGKYNIEYIASGVRKYLKKYNLTTEMNCSIEKKKEFSAYKTKVKDKIKEFNDYRDTLFAHSDENTMLKVENVDIESAYDILIKCLLYCCKIIGIIDEDKMDEGEEIINLASIEIETKYFSTQLIRK